MENKNAKELKIYVLNISKEVIMTFFSRNEIVSNGQRLTGFSRFTEVLGRDFKRFLFTSLMTCLCFLPFAAGITFSILSTSVLLVFPASVIGGIVAGPALSCLYDIILRGLRDASGKLFSTYVRGWKQNFRQSILPSILFCLIFGFYIFMSMLFFWSDRFPGIGTIAIYLMGLFFFLLLFSFFWPQIALFDQPFIQSARNSLLFSLRFFPKAAGSTLIKFLFYLLIVLFLPWTVVLLPLIGFWLPLYLSLFLIYDTLNDCFGIEEKIAASFPEQVPFYEDDETWLKRKQEENS